MFHFRLQPLLDHKKQIEEKQALEFSNINRRLDCEQEALDKMIKERRKLTARLKDMGENRLCAGDVSVYFSYIHYMRQQENRQKEVVDEVEKKLEAQRQELIHASRKKKVLEIFKDKVMEEYRLDLIRREQKELDEAGVLRAGRSVQIEETDRYL